MNLKLMLLMIVVPLWLSACGDAEEPATPAPHTEGTKDSGHGEAGHKEAGGHDEHAGEEGDVALTPEQIKAAGITLMQAGPAQIRETLPLYGVVAPNAERMREVAARFPGAIRNVAKKIGDTVREGEALATVEANESLQTYHGHRAALRRRHRASRQPRRADRRQDIVHGRRPVHGLGRTVAVSA